MARLTYAQLKSVWLSAAKGTKYDDNTWASLMAAIAEAESGGNSDAINPKDNGGKQTSWGLWQISDGTHAEVSPAWSDPESNAKLAIGKLNSQGLGAWGTYTSGAYKAYLNNATTPATGGTGQAPGTTTAGGRGSGSTINQSAGVGLSGEISSAQNTQSDCAWSISPFSGGGLIQDVLGHPSWCILSWSQVRAIISVGVFVAGGAVALFAAGTLLAATPAGQAVITTTKSALKVGAVAA